MIYRTCDMYICDTTWYDMIRYDRIWYDMIRYGMTWNDMMGMIWYDKIWYDMKWYDGYDGYYIIWCGVYIDLYNIYISFQI